MLFFHPKFEQSSPLPATPIHVIREFLGKIKSGCPERREKCSKFQAPRVGGPPFKSGALRWHQWTQRQSWRTFGTAVARAQLWIQASTLRYPLSLWRLPLQSCRWDRKDTCRRHGLGPSVPGQRHRGVARLCHHGTHAPLHVTFAPSAAFPSVKLAVFVEDLGFRLLRATTNAGLDPSLSSSSPRCWVEDFQPLLTHDKTLVVTSTKSLATSVAWELGGRKLGARDLGIDVGSSCGRLRTVPSSPLLGAKRRMFRITQFRKATRKGGAKAHVAGVALSVVYGAGVRRRLVAGHRIRHPSRHIVLRRISGQSVPSRSTRDGERWPLESTSARSTLCDDMLSVSHRLDVHQSHHHLHTRRWHDRIVIRVATSLESRVCAAVSLQSQRA